ncbi:carbamate kinase [Streptomyces sp. MBT97]|uniref:amino acid kinase family protein n=1 Tax=Streptomyces sp. MBT97 TaxID=2800411 RepID=UPI00190B9C9E|nr:carbamate kinase [Streptomyces sp. MBT97]MBK3633449.1 carbamate kinase [Streptomyces sp. MBT97]
MRIVVALGGNVLLHRGERPDAAVQQANVERAVIALAPLAKDNELVITHANGPQIGLLAMESVSEPALSAPYPLDILGAQTQGMIGSLLARSLRGVVPSPAPEGIVEADTVHALLDSGALVVWCGGGGVPVTSDRITGELTGVEAVVDKDLTAAFLAEELKADFLLILTDVPNVYTDFGTPRQRPLLDVTPAQLLERAGPAGPMRPKAAAAARFVDRTGALAAIGALDAAYAIVHGTSGTLVRPQLVFE